MCQCDNILDDIFVETQWKVIVNFHDLLWLNWYNMTRCQTKDCYRSMTEFFIFELSNKRQQRQKKPGTSTTDAQLNEFPFVHSTSFILINHKEEACSIYLLITSVQRSELSFWKKIEKRFHFPLFLSLSLSLPHRHIERNCSHTGLRWERVQSQNWVSPLLAKPGVICSYWTLTKSISHPG